MADVTIQLPQGVEITGAIAPGFETILTTEAIDFIVGLERKFRARRDELLERRKGVQDRIDGGWLPDFLPETKSIREGDWTVAPVPADLQDRRVEITGPVDRKMIVNALNCGANVFMADFEDATTPTWSNQMQGQINLRDAVRRQIDFTDPQSGREYKLNDKTATLLVRPRGWHLPENHILVDGQPMVGAFMDFGLYFFHNAKELLKRGSGPYFYLPKMESHLEARLWNDVFVHAQKTLGVPQGSIKGTVLIETILATFEADEILYELREHSAGLNCGRWDYMFSVIKKFRNRPEFVLPDRDQLTMTVPFMRSYCLYVIATCHRRNAHAMGGMAAQIPIRNDEKANEEALAKVRGDKEREVKDGHDGTWVAHPGLVPIAKMAFDAGMKEANQIARKRQDVHVTAKDLLAMPKGTITEKGVRHNLDVGVQYLAAWLGGSGCVPIYNLMEDAATAEICRAQVWQWLHHGASITDGPKIDAVLVDRYLDEALQKIEAQVGEDRFEAGHYREAAEMFREMITTDAFNEFLTLPAYARITAAA